MTLGGGSTSGGRGCGGGEVGRRTGQIEVTMGEKMVGRKWKIDERGMLEGRSGGGMMKMR